MNMDGKTVLITGSTDGVGRYVAAQLAAAGAKVLIHGRDAARAKTLVDEIKRGRARRRRSSIRPICRRWRARDSSPNAVIADHKRLDVFVSNAGIGSQNVRAGRRRPALTAMSCALPSIISRASCSPICCCRLLKASAPSRIVNVASLGQHPIDFDDVMITKGYQRLARLCAEQAVADHVHHRSRRVN